MKNQTLHVIGNYVYVWTTLKGIQVDDKKKLWWLQTGVPSSIRNANGDGKWATGTWRCLDDDDSLGDINVSQVRSQAYVPLFSRKHLATYTSDP